MALVIGNSSYPESMALESPAHDAKAVSRELLKLGWTVRRRRDLSGAEQNKVVQAFVEELKGQPADEVLFYFSGHGMEIGGENFALPIDFNPTSSAKWNLTSLQKIINDITPYSGTRIVILDCCRGDRDTEKTLSRTTVPKGFGALDRDKGSGEVTPSLGLAAMEAAENTFLAFASAPGKPAYAVDGTLSPFTAALIKHIDALDLPIWNVTARVRNEVKEKTGSGQIPWNNESLIRPFFFNPGSMLLFTGNAIALTALLLYFIIYTFALYGHASWQHLFLSAGLLGSSFWVLMSGTQGVYGRVRGDGVFSTKLSPGRWRTNMMAHFISGARRGGLGGFLGSVLAALSISIPYYVHWAEIDRSMPNNQWPLAPLGSLMVEIAVAAAVVSSLLGTVTLFFFSIRIAKRALPEHVDTRIGTLLDCCLGGAVVGAIAAPFVTLFFGLKARPPVYPLMLLPGCILGSAFIIFSIVNFDYDKITRRRLIYSMLAALVAVGSGALAALVVFAPLQLLGTVDGVANFMLDNSQNVPILLVGGMAYGIPVGIVLGFVIGMAIILTEQWTHARIETQ